MCSCVCVYIYVFDTLSYVYISHEAVSMFHSLDEMLNTLLPLLIHYFLEQLFDIENYN